MKKEETNDIIQYLHPRLIKIGIPLNQIKQDVTTTLSGNLRGDIWISRVNHESKNFFENILALIEAKHKKCVMGDKDWKDAMQQGKIKSQIQDLNFYIVTNCKDTSRFYNRFNDEEIKLDGNIITSLEGIEILNRIQTQVSENNSNVLTKGKIDESFLEKNFCDSLLKLAKIYRSCGIKKDDRIDPTVSFVILKYIGEKENVSRTLKKEVKLWEDYGKQSGNYKSNFISSVKEIFSGEYGGEYNDFKDLIKIHDKLKNEHYQKIYKEFSKYHFHGCGFDVFGAIYEEFASQQKKKEFGQFYTRRHITSVISNLLLKDEKKIRKDLKIADPGCGSGGFLTEAYKALKSNLETYNNWNESAKDKLMHNTFWGYDNEESSVARTKLNMFLVGDGHTHIYENDSLIGWNKDLNWQENSFDYILTNPPYGIYDGDSNISTFDFTNESRYEMMFMEKIVKSCKPGGKMAVVIPDGLLESPSRANFRLKILQHCDIYAIISLTKFAFAPYTKEKTYVVFMEKKPLSEVGKIQKTPIWNFIVDYDGFANSDKRYLTPLHNDLPDLEKYFMTGAYSKEVDGINKIKCGSVNISSVNENNYYNLLSEYHLRKEITSFVSEKEFDSKLKELKEEFKKILESIQ